MVRRRTLDISHWIAGGIFVGIGLYLLIFTNYNTPGFGSLFLGIFISLVMKGGLVEEEVSKSSLESGVESLDLLLDDLGLSGNGVFVPEGDTLSSPRTYVPAGSFQRLPELYDEMMVVSSEGGRVGISLIPTGKPLFDEASSRLENTSEGIEGAREIMGMLSHGMGLTKSCSIREDEEVISIRLTHGVYGDYCSKLRENRPDICVRTGCPICSAFLTAACSALSEPLLIKDFEVRQPHIIYRMERVK